ncbi:MAG: BON domain-containing protein [Pirellulaceae bacterium]
MRRITITAVGVLTLVLAEGGNLVHGQMFGARSVGQPLSRRPGAGTASVDLEDIGSLQGNERFLRQNRRATDFVGNDVRELQRFVGALQARALGLIPPATQGLTRRVDRSETINQPLPPPRPGAPYPPRMEVSFPTLPVPAAQQPSRRALDTLARSHQMPGASRIEVLMEGRTAILQGEVLSEADRDLAEILLTFEPGISAIRNELQVNPDLRESSDSLAAIRQRLVPREAWTKLSHGTRSPGQASSLSTLRSY